VNDERALVMMANNFTENPQRNPKMIDQDNKEEKQMVGMEIERTC